MDYNVSVISQIPSSKSPTAITVFMISLHHTEILGSYHSLSFPEILHYFNLPSFKGANFKQIKKNKTFFVLARLSKDLLCHKQPFHSLFTL